MRRLSDSCKHFDRNQSAFLDGRLEREERQQIKAHLAVCRRCSDQARLLGDVRSALRTLPAPKPPAALTTRLRIAASRELAVQRARTTRWRQWRENLALTMNNLMRPVALPAAGGIFAALLLFGILSPQLGARSVGQGQTDVPTGLYTGASVKMTGPSVSFEFEELEIEAVIDEQGRMVDYSIPDSQRAIIKDPAVQRAIENSLLFTQFTPATAFGQPTNGRVRLRLRSSSIDVKG